MAEERTLDQIEQDNPGFFLKQRFYGGDRQFTIFFTDAQGQRQHCHCTAKEQIQPLIERLKEKHRQP